MLENDVTKCLPSGLFPIVDENYSQGLSSPEIIEALMDMNCPLFVARNKKLSPQEYREYIQEINLMQNEMDFEFIIHNRVDLVLQSDAIGIHLNAEGMSVREARDILGSDKIVGYSAHSIQEVEQAHDQGADYVFLGAIFETPKHHKNHPVLGMSTLYKASKINIPVYAIGGIHTGNLAYIKEAGIAGFSALRSVYENQDLEHNLSKLTFMWNEVGESYP